MREVALQISTCAYFGPLPVEESLEAVQRASQLQKESMASEALTFRASGGLLNMAGRFEEAGAAFDRALQLFGELGDPVRGTIARQIDGEALRLQGRFEEAERLFREMIATLDAVGETGFNSTVSGLLASTLCDLGRYDEADALCVTQPELAAEDDFASQALWRMARARVLAHRGEFGEALLIADEAIAINDGTDYLVWQGDGREVRESCSRRRPAATTRAKPMRRRSPVTSGRGTSSPQLESVPGSMASEGPSRLAARTELHIEYTAGNHASSEHALTPTW